MLNHDRHLGKLRVCTKSSKRRFPPGVWNVIHRESVRVDRFKGFNVVQGPGLRDEQLLEMFHISLEPVGEAEPCLIGREILIGDCQSFVEKAHQLKAA